MEYKLQTAVRQTWRFRVRGEKNYTIFSNAIEINWLSTHLLSLSFCTFDLISKFTVLSLMAENDLQGLRA